MNDIVTIDQDGQVPAAAFAGRQALGYGANAGAVAIEQERAIAEAQGKLVLAKRFPRSLAAATVEFLDACRSPEFAARAFYAVPNRGSGPSIRFAEEAARCYGNFEFGHRELSRTEGFAGQPGKSEIEVYAWDVEKNNFSRRQITVMHVRDKQGGAAPLKDQTDIDNRIANVASKQMRGRILAILPKSMVAAGELIAKQTLAGNSDKPVSQRITDMTGAFGKFGVTPEMLAKHLGHSLDATTVDELADLAGIYNAVRDGAKASEFFGAKDEAPAEASATAGKVAAAAAKGAEKAPAPKAEAKAAPKADKPPEAAQEAPQEAAQAVAAGEPQADPEPASEAAQEAPKEESVF